ncbi:MAG: hypothetical protein K6T87_16075 [Roseiflexus sp.]|uniref:hypothetical protein n=1 Tax=Roseiflexus sp. TaxID=2562120 RepID=UPI0025E057B9|nr:hypothetical protein [Roseiflexus sp.]MCL6542074.1 hypothetical protein [Roseiflexus sp.]
MLPFEKRFFHRPKLDRILYLGQMGLNIPIFIKIIETQKELKKFEKEKGNLVFSFRTQKVYLEDEKVSHYLSPFFPNTTASKELSKLKKAIKEGFQILVFEAIDPSWTVARGNILVDKVKKDIEIEYKLGQGTVRDLEREIPLRINSKYENLTSEFLHKFNSIFLNFYSIDQLIKFQFSRYILEFSVIDRAVGIKKLPVIFWEIREG